MFPLFVLFCLFVDVRLFWGCCFLWVFCGFFVVVFFWGVVMTIFELFLIVFLTHMSKVSDFKPNIRI